MAPRLPPRSRARAAGDRPERDAALLAVRPAGAERLHASVHGCAERRRHECSSPPATRSARGAPTARSASTGRRRSSHRSRPAGLRNEVADDRPGRRRAECVVRELRRDGVRPARPRAHELQLRLHPLQADRSARSALLHAPRNVDRLWAKWQWIHKRTNPAELACASRQLSPIGSATGSPTRCGRGTASPASPRPSTAPGGALAPSPSTTAPGNTPRVRSMLDYQAVAGGAPLGFAYDDVPFEV